MRHGVSVVMTRPANLPHGHRNRLSPGRQALLVLAHLRNGDTYIRLAEGFRVGLATVFRYVREAVDLLVARAPSLTAALWRLAGNGHRLGILDGTVVRIDRLGGDLDRRYYSGKHHHHGVNLQGLVDPRRGDLVWISEGLPGSTHDLTGSVALSAGKIETDLGCEATEPSWPVPAAEVGVVRGRLPRSGTRPGRGTGRCRWGADRVGRDDGAEPAAASSRSPSIESTYSRRPIELRGAGRLTPPTAPPDA
jgi:hypothetical protein